NGKKGKQESQTVIDALNLSAYGSPDGAANVSVPAAQTSFERWRDHKLAQRLARIYHWEHTFLYALLEYAQKSGKIGTWSFIWLKPMDRVMFYCLNTVGRKTPHAESALCFSQHQFERRCAKMAWLPLKNDYSPRIFSK